MPWLDPQVSGAPLIAATRDVDGRVRATAAQSLVAVSRRLPEDSKAAAVAAALSLLDDRDDEAACAGAELVAALNPPNAQDALAVRAKGASDLRYAWRARRAWHWNRTQWPRLYATWQQTAHVGVLIVLSQY